VYFQYSELTFCESVQPGQTLYEDIRGTEYGEENTMYVYIIRAFSFSLKYIELGSSDVTHVASTVDGNEVIGIEAERVSDISEVVLES